VVAVLVLGSCQFPGFFGDGFDIEMQLHYLEDGVPTPMTEKGLEVVSFSMYSDPDPMLLFGGLYTDGTITAHITTPDDSLLLAWADILPMTPVVSDNAARACVVNSIEVAIEGGTPIEYRNAAGTTWGFWTYSDRDVNVSASGLTEGLGGVSVNLSMDIDLKKGWNLIVLNRSGSAEPYTDAYSVGDAPDGMYLLLEASLR